jgi:hypothetical protein
MKILIKESQYVYLLENLEKNKKFLTNVMGMDFTGKIKQVTSTYDVPMEFDNNISPSVIKSHLNSDGPMYLFELDDKKFLYQDKGHVDFFIDQNGYYYNDEIARVLGIDIMGLRFSDIINMYFNEEETLNESTDKNKKFLTKHMGIDFTGKLKKITSAYKVPYNFYRNGGISLNHAMSYLNNFGPMYFFELGDYEYLYQDRGNKDWFIDERGVKYIKDEFSERLGLDVLGLRFSDIINMYFNEEETLNENINKKKKLFTKMLGEDLIDSIQEITSTKQLPKEFLKSIGESTIQTYIDKYGPLYYFVYNNEEPLLYKDREDYEMYINNKGKSFLYGEITDRLGLSDIGLKFSDVIDTIFNEEETLNESLIIEETNKSLRLLTKYYDIEGDGASYRGDNKIQTLVTFFPKDYDNEMSDHAGSSICNWEFDPPSDLIFKFMSLPNPSFIPLMDYVGETEDLEEYLEEIHRKEAKKFLIRLKKGRS